MKRASSSGAAGCRWARRVGTALPERNRRAESGAISTWPPDLPPLSRLEGPDSRNIFEIAQINVPTGAPLLTLVCTSGWRCRSR